MRDLFIMFQARVDLAWNTAGTIAAAVYNSQSAEGARLLTSEDFHPWRKPGKTTKKGGWHEVSGVEDMAASLGVQVPSANQTAQTFQELLACLPEDKPEGPPNPSRSESRQASP